MIRWGGVLAVVMAMAVLLAVQVVASPTPGSCLVIDNQADEIILITLAGAGGDGNYHPMMSLADWPIGPWLIAPHVMTNPLRDNSGIVKNSDWNVTANRSIDSSHNLRSEFKYDASLNTSMGCNGSWIFIVRYL